MPGYASHILERYLTDIGMRLPADAAQQYQLCLMQQWMDHLEVVLRDNDVPRELAQRIMREFLYGAMPQNAEAQMRQTISEDLAKAYAAGVTPTGLG